VGRVITIKTTRRENDLRNDNNNSTVDESITMKKLTVTRVKRREGSNSHSNENENKVTEKKRRDVELSSPSSH
jgi:hypothetical protein